MARNRGAPARGRSKTDLPLWGLQEVQAEGLCEKLVVETEERGPSRPGGDKA